MIVVRTQHQASKYIYLPVQEILILVAHAQRPFFKLECAATKNAAGLRAELYHELSSKPLSCVCEQRKVIFSSNL